jgi:hypothetical protein
VEITMFALLLTIHLIDRCPPAARCLPGRLVARMKAETQRIWSGLDVEIAWTDSSERDRSAAGITVFLEEHADAPWPPEQGFALAALHRPADRCGWAVAYLWVRRIREHVASVHVAGQPYVSLPAMLEDTILVRALARALAHEIGHYLLGTSTHTERGLMRAHMLPQELMENTIQSQLGLGSAERASLNACGHTTRPALCGSGDCAGAAGGRY